MRFGLLIFSLYLLVPSAGAQPAQDYVNARKSGDAAAVEAAKDALLGPGAIFEYIWQQETSLATGIRRLANARSDQQTGLIGLTSLVARPDSAAILSAALESVAGNSSTTPSTRVNALAAYRFLTGTKAPDCSTLWLWCKTDDANPLRSLSVLVSASTLGIRYELWNRQDPRGKSFQEAWMRAGENLRPRAAALSQAAQPLVEELIQLPDYASLRDAAYSKLDTLAADPAVIDRYRQSVLEQFYQLWRRKGTRSFSEFDSALAAFRQQSASLLKDTLFRKALSVDYTLDRSAGQPALSNVGLIFETPLGRKSLANTAPSTSLTLNVAAGIRTGKWHDVQAGLELDRKLPPGAFLGAATFTLAGYFQYLKENAVISLDSATRTPLVDIALPQPAVEVLNTKGAIALFQARLSFPLGNSGVSIPVAVSWANRTELIKATDIRGQFGLTFDLDKLLLNTMK
jgi:hypothetical protein